MPTVSSSAVRSLVTAAVALAVLATLAVPAAAEAEVVVHVDREHPAAADSNPGTPQAPLASIEEGVALASRANAEGRAAIVRVAPGVYREAVQVGNPGGAALGRLTIEAPDGAVLSGAEPISGWTPQSDGSWAAPWPHRWGAVDLPSGWSSYWSSGGKEAERDLLRRSETVFDGDVPLRAVGSPAALEPGTFHVDEDAGMLRVRLSGGREPAQIEASVHQPVLRIRDRAHVVVRGFTIERARGALQTHGVGLLGTEGVTLEDLTIRQHAYDGLATTRTRGTVVRRVALIDNGVKGLAGWRDTDLLAEDVLLEGNNWRGWAHEHRGWDVVHKWMGTRNATARRVTSRNNFGRGFWLDTDNQHTTVDGLVSAGNARDGIFLERNPGPIVIRNSVFCGNDGPGVLEGRSNNVTLAGSRIFENNADWQIRFTGQQRAEEIRDWETDATNIVDSRNWRLEGNTVAASGDGMWLWSLNNLDSTPVVRSTVVADGNHWYHAGRANPFWASADDGGAFTLEEWRAWLGRGNERTSVWEPSAEHCPLGDGQHEPEDQDDPPPADGVSNRFADVPSTHVHAAGVERVAAAGITAGCAVDLFCPASTTTRAQMASFLARARHLDVSGMATVDFTDVSPMLVHRPAILAVTAAQIARGCAADRYCPNQPMTRAQMATFLANALQLQPQAPPAFADVAAGSVHAAAIAAVSEAGIALGCDDERFCPNEAVTRGQIASFLARALDAGL